MAERQTPASLGWEWDDERGGWKPPSGQSGMWMFNAETGLSAIPDQPISSVPSSSGGSFSGSSSISASVPSVPSQAVKVATPDIIELDSATIPVELMQDLLFEDIGGQELLTVSRHDILNGKPVAYQPIKNIGDISLQYNSDNILSMPDTIKNYFKNFNVVLSSTVVEIDENNASPNIYNDTDSQSQTFGSVILEFKNLSLNQQIEVQILKNGTPFDDTIYVGTGVES